jgi:4-amino-4-deoxy-L-arabinose transferase-like glycosyltransferase
LKFFKLNWLLLIFVALAPLWTLGMFHRVYWTPDEPREAAIAWRMSVQTDRTLPQLAEQHFLEKPPLSYWLSAATMKVFGDSATAARLPNVLYALISILSLGFLVRFMAGNTAAVIASVTTGSALMAYQVSIWLAPDACLVAGCSLALLGAFRGYVAQQSRDKLLWYTLMHLGALMGFMAKSAPGWMVPALALLGLIAWENRWRELKCWQLWAGLVIQIVVIGAWVAAVLDKPEGAEALRIMFWNNIAGRFTDLQVTGALNYTSGHNNWPGKYLIELPYYLFPWTLLAAAALYRAWSKVRVPDATATPWRFAITSCLPFLFLLSFSSTARGIYAAPALLGFGILMGLWAQRFNENPEKNTVNTFDRFAIRSTIYCVAIFALFIIVALCFMAMADVNTENLLTLILAAVGTVIVAGLAIGLSFQAHKQHLFIKSFSWSYLVFASSLSIGAAALMPIIDQWQNLRPLAAMIKQDVANRSLALMAPDETTIAMMDYQLRTPFTIIGDGGQDPIVTAKQWLNTQGTQGLVLIKLPGRGTGKVNELLYRMGKHKKPANNDLLLALEQAKAAQRVKIYELPQGRRYALVGAIPST